MNGYLSGHAISDELTKLADEFRAAGGIETFTVRTMSERIAAQIETLRLKAIADIDEIAVEVVAADAMDNNPLNTGTWHKVLNIKAVRERTGCGLSEAKQAVARAYVTVARNLAQVALENLASENAKHGYGLRQFVDADTNKSVLSNLWTAANTNQPF